MAQPFEVLRLPTRDFVVLYFTRKGQRGIGLFDSTGKYLRQLGRMGDGPGEFRRPTRVAIVAGDSVAVFEHHRVTVFSPDLRFVRSEVPARVSPGEGAWGALSTSMYVGMSSVMQHGPKPWPVFLYRGRRPPAELPIKVGEEFHAIGLRRPELIATVTALHHKSIGYRIALLDTNLTVKATFTRTPWWWIGWDTTKSTSGRPEGNGSRVLGIQIQSDTRIITMVRSPTDQWRNGSTRPPNAWNTIVEMIDLQKMEVAASAPVIGEPVSTGFVEPNVFATVVEDDDGFNTIYLWEIIGKGK